MSKTKPFSIRFDEEKLNFIQEKENIKSRQAAVDFLINGYWEMYHPRKPVFALPLERAVLDESKEANPISFDTKQLSNPFNLPYYNGGKEEAIESAAKEKKPPVIKDKGANKNTIIKKGKNTYWAEIKKCSTRETIEAKRAEVHADTNLNYLDVPFLNNACDRQLLTLK